MQKLSQNLYKNEKGSVLVLFSFFLVIIMIMAALAIDVGYFYVVKSRLQNAVDAAALAGAYKLPDTGAAQDTALDYVTKNGFSDQNVDIAFEGANTIITVTKKHTFPSYFAKIVGQESFTAAALAKAEKPVSGGGGVGPFDYCLFSGREQAQLYLGGSFTINGDVHSNGRLNISPGSGRLNGKAQACQDVYVNTNTATVNEQLPNAEFIPMMILPPPAIPAAFNTELTASQAQNFSSFTGNTKITGNCAIRKSLITIDGFLYVEGDLLIEAWTYLSPVNLHGTIYVTGKLTLPNSLHSNGHIYAGGDIIFGGPTPTIEGMLYSGGGKIEFSSGFSGYGIIYAPAGKIYLNHEINFHGSIVGDTIDGVPSILNLGPPDEPFDFLPSGTPGRIRLIE